MPKIPEMKPDEKKEKKRGALFADLFSGRGGGLLGGSGLGGGLLATKAGVVALILAGTTVAGGIGLIGYKFFGPSRADRSGGAMSLFDPRPPQAAADGSASGASGGTSDSLNQLVSANQGAGGLEAGKDGAASAPTDQAKADAATDAQSTDAAKAAEAAKNAAATGASASSAPKAFKGGKIESKFAGFSAGGGGSSGHSFGANTQVASAKLAPSSAMHSAKAGAGGVRGLLGLGSNTAGKQLLGVSHDQRGAITSQGAGATYDGSRGTGIGGGSSPTGGPGSAPTGADTNPSTGGGNGQDRFPQPPPAAGAVNVTPWQSAIQTAEMLLAASALLIFLASKGKDFPVGGQIGALVAASIAALLAGMAAYIGHQIASGPYGQVFQGNMFVAAGSFMAASAVAAAITSQMESPPGILTFAVYASGALGLGMGIVGAMRPAYSYPPREFSSQPGGKAPDYHLFGGG
ncbi:MAG: hypothetical protein HY077_03340 [Elusimicrobia bacterium]|nr:hypothetical protein [Elusimicrobiota bacterium]